MSICSPFVNILIASYNQEKIIKDTVLSCLNQDYDNLVVVVSDDGSTDSTPEILTKLQYQYPDRLRVVLNGKNQGITKNCNVALAVCDADLIALSGGDDIFYSHKVRRQVSEFVKNPSLVLCYHPCHILSGGNIVGTVGNRKKDLVHSFYEIISNYGAELSGPSPMIARSAIPEGGYNESIATASDWLFQIEVSSKGEVKRIDDILSQYRKHEGNIGNKIFNYADDFLRTLDFVSEKYGSDQMTLKSVSKGRRRFLLGILYNAAMVNNAAAFEKYLSIYKGYGYSFHRIISLVNSNVIRVFLPRVRSFLKKIV